MEKRPRRFPARLLTGCALVFFLVVLAAPDDYDSLTATGFLRFPVEALACAWVALLLPARAHPWSAVLGGVCLGGLAVVKVLDVASDAVLQRPFDLVLDWPLLGPAVDYVRTTSGAATAILAVGGAITVTAGVAVLSVATVVRLSRSLVVHRGSGARVVVVLTVLCVIIAPGARPGSSPLISATSASTVLHHARQVPASLRDQARFADEAAADPFSAVPGERLLTGLRGKDVVFVFVESFGRVALEHPDIAPGVGRAMEEGTNRLARAGFATRSAYLTSPTAGGGSWLAHATFLSGLWIHSQQRYDALVASDRLALPGAFREAGWHTVGVMPGITRAWPEGAFFGYDEVYGVDDMGYRGPPFGYATMPDQYALSFFERSVRSRQDNGRLMAVIPILVSHAPWSPVPRRVGWDAVGDGSVFAAMPNGGDAAQAIWQRPPDEVRADYRRSLEYSVDILVSYIETFGDDDLVVVLLGDHPPASAIAPDSSNKDVPVAIVSRDGGVLRGFESSGWSPGLRPAGAAPVVRMDAFRDQFLTTFSPAASRR